MLLKTIDCPADHREGDALPPHAFCDIPIREGEMFLLPGNIPHNPVRFANTVGLVIERVRSSESVDRLRWYCQQCRRIVREDRFHCTDIEDQLKGLIQAYAASPQLRTCPACGLVNPP